MKYVPRVIALLFALPFVASAQFNSGSTGADGALDLATMSCPGNICRIQLPESGILNYTTVNVPSGKTLRFITNSRNTPVYMLAQGNVQINGLVNVSSIGSFCGSGFPPEMAPGGFRGGVPGRPGFGPGGGQINYQPGAWVGPLSLVPIVGGSGGAGSSSQFYAFDGGSGGGAIVIASSTSISGSSGGFAAKGSNHGNCSSSGAAGSGGAIRIVANTVNLLGGAFDACTGSICGVVRIEATSLTFTGGSNPAAVLSPINPNVISVQQPLLSIASVGGFNVPSYAGARFDTVDILLPNSIADPVNVGISANNIPTGTQVQVGFASGSPSGTSTSCNLSGSFANSSCTATISSLNRTGVTYLLATAAFNPPAPLAGFNPKGADHVAKIKLESVLGAKQKYVFLRSDNSVIDAAKVPKEFLLYYGM